MLLHPERSAKFLPVDTVDLKDFHVPLTNISVAQLRATGVSFAICKYPVEDVFGNSAILHTKIMTQPSEPRLYEQRDHGC